MNAIYLLDDERYFWLFVPVVLIAVLGISTFVWKKKVRQQFGSHTLLERLAPNQSNFKPILKSILVLCTLSFIVIGLVNPKMGTKLETVKREGVDLVFAMDISKSMLSEDVAPSRIKKSKQLVSQIINQLTGDRIGIIAYAASAFPQLPITTDYASGKLFLQQLNTDIISSQGTAIGEAIALAKTYYNDKEQTNRILVLVSDGEGHDESDIAKLAQEARAEGIRIITIGVGTEKGGPIPIKKKGILEHYKKDHQGNTVITKLNSETLKEIAENADGVYIEGTNSQEVVSKMNEVLNSMEKKEFEAKQFADFEDQFQWFIAISLILIFVNILIFERRTLWVKKLNVFNEKEN